MSAAAYPGSRWCSTVEQHLAYAHEARRPRRVTRSTAAWVRAVAHGSSRSRSAAIRTAGFSVRAASRLPVVRAVTPDSHTEPAPVSASRGEHAAAGNEVAPSLVVRHDDRRGRPARRPAPAGTTQGESRDPAAPRPHPAHPAERRGHDPAQRDQHSPGAASTGTPTAPGRSRAQVSGVRTAPQAQHEEHARRPRRAPSPADRRARPPGPRSAAPGSGVAPASRSPASRRSRCTAPMRAHWPRNPSTGTNRSSSARITPARCPGWSRRP